MREMRAIANDLALAQSPVTEEDLAPIDRHMHMYK